MEEDKEIFLGFDFSTQQIKAVAIDSNLDIVAEELVQFDKELPEYRTHGGVHVSERRVTAPPIMWVKALDMLMEKLRIVGVDFSKVRAISGAGQQHGSVYWRTGIDEILASLKPEKFLHDQLAHAFALLDSPVWMDSSTTEQCKALEAAVGGQLALSEITGSKAYERFTGNQIAKIFQNKPEVYSNTDRISLVSSFAATLFLGRCAPIDLSDAGGMNLLDLRQRCWSQICLDACATGLSEKLQDPVESSKVIGEVSHYMQERYDLSPECKVVAFTGDNPSSLAALKMRPGDIGISLGTSDTVFVWIKELPEIPQTIGHIWPNPVERNSYMALLCYKNGSLTREIIRNETSEGTWDLFNQLLESTPRGNFGNIGMYFTHPEITPHNRQGEYRFNKSGERVTRFASKEAEVRALVEGQFMAKRIHAEKMGFKIDSNTRILVTGGASSNKSILQVIADIFNASVYSLPCVNSAALGAAYRARHSLLGGEDHLSFADVTDGGEEKSPKLVCTPHKDAKSVYKPLLERYKGLEEKLSSTD